MVDYESPSIEQAGSESLVEPQQIFAAFAAVILGAIAVAIVVALTTEVAYNTVVAWSEIVASC